MVEIWEMDRLSGGPSRSLSLARYNREREREVSAELLLNKRRSWLNCPQKYIQLSYVQICTQRVPKRVDPKSRQRLNLDSNLEGHNQKTTMSWGGYHQPPILSPASLKLVRRMQFIPG